MPGAPSFPAAVIRRIVPGDVGAQARAGQGQALHRHDVGVTAGVAGVAVAAVVAEAYDDGIGLQLEAGYAVGFAGFADVVLHERLPSLRDRRCRQRHGRRWMQAMRQGRGRIRLVAAALRRLTESRCSDRRGPARAGAECRARQFTLPFVSRGSCKARPVGAAPWRLGQGRDVAACTESGRLNGTRLRLPTPWQTARARYALRANAAAPSALACAKIAAIGGRREPCSSIVSGRPPRATGPAAGKITTMRISRAAWAVLNGLQLVFTLAWTAVWICLALLVLLVTRRRHLPLRMASRCWAPGLLRGSGATLVVRGVERVDWSRPHVIVANHQSMIDICALFRAVPVPLQFLLKQELSKVPFVGAYAKAMGMIFIERTSAREATKRMREAAQLVKSGATLCVFPEGTRSRDGDVLPFKSGAFQVALDSGADVVPVAIEGSGQVLQLQGLFTVRPGTITVTIGEPLRTAEIADRQALAEQARNRVVAMKQAAA